MLTLFRGQGAQNLYATDPDSQSTIAQRARELQSQQPDLTWLEVLDWAMDEKEGN